MPFVVSQVYNLEKVAEQCELPGGFVVGAGAGPAHVIGVNSEVSASWDTYSDSQRSLIPQEFRQNSVKEERPISVILVVKASRQTSCVVLCGPERSPGGPGQTLVQLESKRLTGSFLRFSTGNWTFTSKALFLHSLLFADDSQCEVQK